MSGKWENPNVPHSGWECVDIADLGAPTCQMCEHELIRYAHYMRHSDYSGLLVVGCICAGRMEGNLEKAMERDAFMRSRMGKRKRWLEREWKTSQKGNQYIKSDGFIVVMKHKNGLWGAFVKSEDGSFEKWSSKRVPNENEMKLAAFDCLTIVLAEKERLEKQPDTKPQIITDEEMINVTDTSNINEPEIKPVQNLLQGELFQIPATTENEPKEIITSGLPETEENFPAEQKDRQCNLSLPIRETTEIELFEKEKIFTAEQMNIFEFIKTGKGHGIIDAVAGAGKTTTIMECAKYVKDKTDVLFCAFNKSIQSEIAKKFNSQGLNQVTVKTIHALGFQLLNDNNDTGKNFIPQEQKYWIILNKDSGLQNKFQEYIEEILNINGYRPNEMGKNRQFAAKNIIHKFYDRLLDMNQKFRATLTQNNIENFINMVEHFNFFTEAETNSEFFNRELEIYFECGNISLDAGNDTANEAMIIDYTDMLYLPFLRNLRASRAYSFLFIDECQDLSKSQLAVVLKYGKIDGRILAVGDPYQSIYGFAGADIESFSRIKKTINNPALKGGVCCFR